RPVPRRRVSTGSGAGGRPAPPPTPGHTSAGCRRCGPALRTVLPESRPLTPAEAPRSGRPPPGPRRPRRGGNQLASPPRPQQRSHPLVGRDAHDLAGPDLGQTLLGERQPLGPGSLILTVGLQGAQEELRQLSPLRGGQGGERRLEL